MPGDGRTEAEESPRFYNLDVVLSPPNAPTRLENRNSCIAPRRKSWGRES